MKLKRDIIQSRKREEKHKTNNTGNDNQKNEYKHYLNQWLRQSCCDETSDTDTVTSLVSESELNNQTMPLCELIYMAGFDEPAYYTSN